MTVPDRTWNPITSTKTRVIETRPNGVRIYEHRVRGVFGKFIAVKGQNDWDATETLAEARIKADGFEVAA